MKTDQVQISDTQAEINKQSKILNNKEIPSNLIKVY